MSFATGKRSKAISDRSGQAFPYKEMVKEWNGSLVHISEFEPKHPQLDPPYHKPDAIALKNPRAMKFQQPTQEFNVTTNGITTTIHSLVPEDPSVQNRRRILLSSIGSVEVSIT